MNSYYIVWHMAGTLLVAYLFSLLLLLFLVIADLTVVVAEVIAVGNYISKWLGEEQELSMERREKLFFQRSL